MRSAIMLLIILGIIVSGCITNPMKDVPVVKVNITYVENKGIVEAINYSLSQGTIEYIARPKKTQAETFPTIAARTTLARGNGSIIGPWQNLPYNGNGTYSFNIGFKENYDPQTNDIVHVSIIVFDKKGERIGYVIENMLWK